MYNALLLMPYNTAFTQQHSKSSSYREDDISISIITCFLLLITFSKLCFRDNTPLPRPSPSQPFFFIWSAKENVRGSVCSREQTPVQRSLEMAAELKIFFSIKKRRIQRTKSITESQLEHSFMVIYEKFLPSTKCRPGEKQEATCLEIQELGDGDRYHKLIKDGTQSY